MTALEICNTFGILILSILIPHSASAQFYTIQKEENIKTEEFIETIVSEPDNEDVIVEEPAPNDSITCPNNSLLSDKEKRELFLKLMYYDNEVNAQYEELFLAYITLAAEREKEKYGPQNFGYENFYETDICGSFHPSTDLTIESLIAEIKKNNLAHPRVVLAQAILETGWFKSSVCRNYNNLFGLTNPRTKEYYRFSTWQESVTAYYTKVQYKYKGGNYLTWLRELGYAEDPDYTAKLRVLLDGPLARYGK